MNSVQISAQSSGTQLPTPGIPHLFLFGGVVGACLATTLLPWWDSYVAFPAQGNLPELTIPSQSAPAFVAVLMIVAAVVIAYNAHPFGSPITRARAWSALSASVMMCLLPLSIGLLHAMESKAVYASFKSIPFSSPVGIGLFIAGIFSLCAVVGAVGLLVRSLGVGSNSPR